MIERLSPGVRNTALLVLALLVGWFLWSVRAVLNPLILAYLLAFIVHPLVLKLEALGWRRRKAVNVIFGGVALSITLVGLGLWFQGRALAQEFTSDDGLGRKVQVRVEQALERYQDEISWVLSVLPGESRRGGAGSENGPGSNREAEPEPVAADGGDGQLQAADLTRLLRGWWTSFLTEERQVQAQDLSLRAASAGVFFVQRLFGSVMAFGLLLLLLPIYTYFLLFELERIHRFVQRYLPRGDRERLSRIGGQIGEVLANFFRGRLLVCLAKGVCLALGLWLAGIDFALLLGLGTGFLSLIPIVGSAAGFVLALLVGLIEHSLGEALLRTGIVFLTAEMLENYVLIPKILGDSLGLHPVVVIFSLMAGGASLGMFGLLIALPLTATLVILAREFLLPVLSDLAERER